MKLISHRGNTRGRIKQLENTLEYITQTLENGFDVEIGVGIDFGIGVCILGVGKLKV